MHTFYIHGGIHTYLPAYMSMCIHWYMHTHPESRPSRRHEIRTFPSWNCFGISCRGAIISCRQNWISWRVLWNKTLCHEIAPFVMKLQASVMNQLSASWVTFLGSDSGPLFFNFFLTFMSDWSWRGGAISHFSSWNNCTSPSRNWEFWCKIHSIRHTISLQPEWKLHFPSSIWH